MFSQPHTSLMTPNGEMPFDINAVYTVLKSTFNGLQFRHGHYGSYLHSFSRCWLQYLWNPTKFRERTSRSSILVSIESAYATSY